MSDTDARPGESPRHHESTVRIRIDGRAYEVHKDVMTGRELRHVPQPPIAPDLTLFEIIGTLPERKIGDDEEVRLHDGLEFVARREVTFHIRIDRQEYEVHKEVMTGLELRRVPSPPIGPDRDLFEVVPGGSDRKIGDNEEVRIHDGLRFFTAPTQINPGLALR